MERDQACSASVRSGRSVEASGEVKVVPKKSGRAGRKPGEQIAENLQQQAVAKASASHFAQQYRWWMLRRILGFTLIGLGAVMILVHVLMHLANVQVVSMQDLLIGYPTGMVLMVVGLVIATRR